MSDSTFTNWEGRCTPPWGKVDWLVDTINGDFQLRNELNEIARPGVTLVVGWPLHHEIQAGIQRIRHVSLTIGSSILVALQQRLTDRPV